MRYDVFLSHASSDNETGFITKLTEAIHLKGSKLLGREITVFTDDAIPTGARWEPELFQKLWLSRVLVPVISPAWQESKWTAQEWNEKWKDLQGDFYYSNQTCILPVTFQLDEAARKNIGEPQTLQYSRGVFFDPMAENKFDDALQRFLADLTKTLTDLDLLERPLPLEKSRGKVFLGMAFSRQVHRWRREVRRHLRGSLFDVCEFDWWDNWTPEGITQKCEEAMKGCIAAVHFLDSSPGPAGPLSSPGGGPYPIELQLTAGRKRTEVNDGFFQVSWAGPQRELRKRDPNKSVFARVQDQTYWEFLEPLIDSSNTDSVNQFSNGVLLHMLESLYKKPTVNEDDEYILQHEKPVACIVYQQYDLSVAQKVKEYLEERKWKVHFPDPGQAKEEFSKRTTFLVYWGAGDQKWCSGNFRDLKRYRTLFASVGAPWAIALYLGTAFDGFKNSTKTNNTLCPEGWRCFTDGNYTDFDPEEVPPLLEKFAVEIEEMARNRAEILKNMKTRVAEP